MAPLELLEEEEEPEEEDALKMDAPPEVVAAEEAAPGPTAGAAVTAAAEPPESTEVAVGILESVVEAVGKALIDKEVASTISKLVCPLGEGFTFPDA